MKEGGTGGTEVKEGGTGGTEVKEGGTGGTEVKEGGTEVIFYLKKLLNGYTMFCQ